MPEVSVIIPSYNHDQYIQHAIDSVLVQTCSDLELIVVDDGSHDSSLDRIRAYTDRRVQVYTQENLGAHAAINRGIELAQSSYIAILNSDDAYMPDRLDKLLAVLRTNPSAGLAASHIQIIDPTGKYLGIKHLYHDLDPWSLPHPELSNRAGDDLFAALLTENYLSTTSNFVFDRAWYSRVGGFRPLRYAHDWDFALRVLSTAGGNMCIVPEPLVEYRIHPRNTIRENKAAMVYEMCWCLAVHLPRCVRVLAPPLAEGGSQMSRLLRSIYTYQADKVLSVLLSMDLAGNEPLALDLLDAQNPVRLECITYIKNDVLLAQQEPPPRTFSSRVRRRVRNLLNRLATKIQ